MKRLAVLATGSLAASLLWLVLACLPPGVPRPEPFLLLVVVAAVRWGSGWGSLTGLVAGLVEGLLSPGPLGGYLLLLGGLGWLLGLARHETSQGPLLLLLLTAAATVALAVGWSGLSLWLHSEPSPTRIRAWLPGALVLNLLLVVPCMNWLRARDRGRRR